MINGQLIRQKRLERGLSQTELAKLARYADKSVVSHIEKGDYTDIPLGRAIQLAKILRVKVTDLVN